MKANFSFLSLLLAISTLFMGCLTETPQGQKKLESTSRQWLNYQGGEKVLFSNGQTSMTLTANARKSIFNDVANCYNVNMVKEVCDIYSMEYDYMMFQSTGNQFRINYAIEKKLNNRELEDQLQVEVQEVDFAPIKGIKTLTQNQQNTTGEMELLPSVKLRNNTFQNVYHQRNGNQEVYVVKGGGVIAFQTNGELWIKMN